MADRLDAEELNTEDHPGFELAFPEDAAVIKTWVSGGAVQTSVLVSQLRLWVRFFEEQEEAALLRLSGSERNGGRDGSSS
jgi:hypothetical protein